jgi:hypothetical protein
MTGEGQTAFFSYARADREFAFRLANDLRLAGASIWIDQLDIKAGERWDHAIEASVCKCCRMIVLLSPAAIASQNVMDEVSYALDEHKPIVPLLYRDCAIPLRLRRVQYVDFRSDYSVGVKTLLSALGSSTQGTMPEATPEDRIRRDDVSLVPENAATQYEELADSQAVNEAATPRTQSRRKYLVGGSGIVLVVGTAVGAWYVLPHDPPGNSYGTEKRVFRDWDKQELYGHFPTVIFATHAFYDAVKPRILIGRFFTESEFASPSEDRRVALLNDGFWKKYLRSEPSVLGRIIYLNDRGFTVIGIASIPGNWRYKADIWLPRPG